jgi:coenzyme F420-0:L-glutamate ligase/coenzyme F420-1:gamma-L-glutamate ligase
MSGLVLVPGRHGPGAAALVRDETQDMFGLGAREAVLSALHEDDPRGFGLPCTALELVVQLSALAEQTVDVRLEGTDNRTVTARLRGTEREQGAADARLRTAAFALGWRTEGGTGEDRALLRFRPATP